MFLLANLSYLFLPSRLPMNQLIHGKGEPVRETEYILYRGQDTHKQLAIWLNNQSLNYPSGIDRRLSWGEQHTHTQQNVDHWTHPPVNLSELILPTSGIGWGVCSEVPSRRFENEFSVPLTLGWSSVERNALGKCPGSLQTFSGSSPPSVLHEEVWEITHFLAFLPAWLRLQFPGCTSYYFLGKSWCQPSLIMFRQAGSAWACVSHLLQHRLTSSIRNSSRTHEGWLYFWIPTRSETQFQVQGRWDS